MNSNTPNTWPNQTIIVPCDDYCDSPAVEESINLRFEFQSMSIQANWKLKGLNAVEIRMVSIQVVNMGMAEGFTVVLDLFNTDYYLTPLQLSKEYVTRIDTISFMSRNDKSKFYVLRNLLGTKLKEGLNEFKVPYIQALDGTHSHRRSIG